MSNSVDVTIVLKTVTCASCGVVFGIEHNLRARLLQDHRTFYCPNGHGQSFTAQTEAEKLRKQLKATEERLAWTRELKDGATRRADHAERRLAATKGVVTKMKKRVGNGTCPCCSRHFTNLERHMATKHPDFAEDDD